MILRVLPEASEEGESAAEHYERERAGLGEKFTQALGSTFEAIVKHPKRNPKHDQAGPGREFRFRLLNRFPYQVIYLVRSNELVVFAVAHTSRDPSYWRHRKA